MTDKTIWSWKDIERGCGIPGNNKIIELGRNIANNHFVGNDLTKEDVIGYIKDLTALDIPVEQKLVIALSQWDYLTTDWGVSTRQPGAQE